MRAFTSNRCLRRILLSILAVVMAMELTMPKMPAARGGRGVRVVVHGFRSPSRHIPRISFRVRGDGGKSRHGDDNIIIKLSCRQRRRNCCHYSASSSSFFVRSPTAVMMSSSTNARPAGTRPAPNDDFPPDDSDIADLLGDVLQDAEKRALVAEDQVEILQRALENKQEEQQAILSRLQEEVEYETRALRERVQQLTSSLETAERDYHSQISQLTQESRSQETFLTEEIAALRTRLDWAQDATQSEKAANEDLRKKLDGMMRTLSEVKGRYTSDLETMKKQFDAERVARSQERRLAMDEINEVRDEISRGVLEAKVEGRQAAEGVRLDLTRRLANKDAVLSDTLGNLKDSQDMVRELTEEVEQLRKERNSVRKMTGRSIVVFTRRLFRGRENDT